MYLLGSGRTLYTLPINKQTSPCELTTICEITDPVLDGKMISGMAFNAIDSTMYIMARRSLNESQLFTFTKECLLTPVGNYPTNCFAGLAVDPTENYLYTVNWTLSRDGSNSLYKIDPTAATATLVGSLGFNAYLSITSLAFYGGELYWSAADDIQIWQWRTVDKTTGNNWVTATTEDLTGVSVGPITWAPSASDITPGPNPITGIVVGSVVGGLFGLVVLIAVVVVLALACRGPKEQHKAVRQQQAKPTPHTPPPAVVMVVVTTPQAPTVTQVPTVTQLPPTPYVPPATYVPPPDNNEITYTAPSNNEKISS
eukprot:TRINITY_DN3457_c1_g1_i2.p1 TRINITY_DN3457_c1_g1~~TRINITY_DN3457_c1_g1_i2.p1  ORF type:complete len:338 (+),score=90.67 TRINITY_DN3457_c1_g1_i2:78-1016(+)